MATALKLKNDIKKLKAAISSKATPKNFIPKLKSQLEKAENELEGLKKTGKPRKTSTTKGTEEKLTALQKLLKKKKFGIYKGKGVDIKKDAERPALPIGKRKSKSGNTYYEYRANRIDVRQPSKKFRIKLEDGGKTAKIDEVSSMSFRNQYDDYEMIVISKEAEKDGGNIVKDRYLVSAKDINEAKEITEKLWLKQYADSDLSIIKIMSDSLYKLKYSDIYADGGMMAKGGEISNYSITPYKTINVANSPDLIQPVYSKSFTISGSLSEANEAAQKYVKTNEEIISAVVTKIHPSGKALKNKKVSYVTKDEIQKFEDGGMMAMGGRIFKDFNGRKTKETWGKHDLSKMYDNNLDLIADIVDYIKHLQKDVSESFARDFVYELMDVLKDGKITYNDGAELTFYADGGMMSHGGKVKVGDIITANTGVKVRVVEYDPMFGGRVRVERIDEYATGKPSQFMPLSKFKFADGGELHRSEQ